MILPDGEPIPFVGWVNDVKQTSQGWQYLTDNEIKEIIGGYGNEGGIGNYTRSLIDKIEAKIKEKNDK